MTTLLMCEPRHYDVRYVINPWMEGNVHQVDVTKAKEQWYTLYGIISDLCSVRLLPPIGGLPDLVFTANAALCLPEHKAVILSRFAVSERQAEEQHFRAWFKFNNWTIYDLDTPFEGAGECLQDMSKTFWYGHGFRGSQGTLATLQQLLGGKVRSVRLVDPRFYHLDTCFCPLPSGKVMYYPPAFDSISQDEIVKVLGDRALPIKEQDALNFACNAVCINQHIIVNDMSKSLEATLWAEGFHHVIRTPLTEFMKAGGAAKCLTLQLD